MGFRVPHLSPLTASGAGAGRPPGRAVRRPVRRDPAARKGFVAAALVAVFVLALAPVWHHHELAPTHGSSGRAERACVLCAIFLAVAGGERIAFDPAPPTPAERIPGSSIIPGSPDLDPVRAARAPPAASR